MVLMLVDINDHPPTFPPSVYSTRVPETINSADQIIEGTLKLHVSLFVLYSYVIRGLIRHH